MRKLWSYVREEYHDGWINAIVETVGGLIIIALVIGVPVGLTVLALAFGGDTAPADGTYPGGPDGNYAPESEWHPEARTDGDYAPEPDYDRSPEGR